jgi:hypothetical protein
LQGTRGETSAATRQYHFRVVAFCAEMNFSIEQFDQAIRFTNQKQKSVFSRRKNARAVCKTLLDRKGAGKTGCWRNATG